MFKFRSIRRWPSNLRSLPLAEAPVAPAMPLLFEPGAPGIFQPEEQHRSSVEPARIDARPSFEKKYVLAPIHRQMITVYLERVLIPDPKFPAGQISSIYYDTPSFDFYQAKRASDFLKTKVRLRWYGSVPPETSEFSTFLEVKEKVGAQRRKDRIPLKVPAHLLRSRRLTDPYLTKILERLLPRGHEVPMPLFPLLIIQYQRRRFIDPSSGARVAIDTEIKTPAINRELVAALGSGRVDACVLEVKGPSRSHPTWLRPIRNQVRPDSFSKYAACLESVLQPTGIRE